MPHGRSGAAAGFLIVLIAAAGGGAGPERHGMDPLRVLPGGDAAPVLNGTTVTLRFRGHTVSGSSGCNQ
ncbi:MAG: hypothetical protein QMD46_09955 [Methanomicrobiales archaeon]|nr:hypothetical protein [Methanomicrobiales archaeon]